MERKHTNRIWTLAVTAVLLAGSIDDLGGVRSTSAQTPLFAGQSSQNREFADPAFESVWRRTDWLVLNGKVKRSYFWGPGVLSDSLMEPYAEGPGGTHLVQYFDKSRMEINNPNADRNNPFFVTNGLLTMELISGNMQTGNNRFTLRWPANIPLASDVDDGQAPTYSSFRGAIARNDTNQVGKLVTALIFKQGTLDFEHGEEGYYGYNRYNVKNAYFEAATKHNIPDVFWQFLNANGVVMTNNNQQVTARLNDPYFYATGYPIADAYWASVKIEGKVDTPVLIQPYQRRVLTYVPNAPQGFKVQMGNIGQHYYDWRYRDAGKPPVLTGQCPTGYPRLGFGKLYENNIVKFHLGCQQNVEFRATVSYQQFDLGVMLGVTSFNYYSARYFEDIFVLFSDGTVRTFPFIAVSTGESPMPTPIPQGPPVSTYNFSSILSANSDVRERLGKAISDAEIYQVGQPGVDGIPVQFFDGGLMVYNPHVARSEIYVLYNTSGYAYTHQGPHVRFTNIDRWAVYDDTFKP